MAAPLSQYGNVQPVLNPVPVETESAGKQALAQVFGKVSDAATQAAININNEKSQAMLLSSATLASKAKDDAQLAIMKNPDPSNVNQVVKNYQQQTQGIMNGTVVNSADRARLKSMVGEDVNQISFVAGRNNIQQAKLQSGIAFNSRVPSAISSITQSLMSNPVQAEVQIDALKTTAAAAFKSGSISQDAYNNVMTTVGTLIDRHSQLMNMAVEGNATAKDYHTMTAFSGVKDQTGAPVNESTKFLHVSLNSDTNYQDAVAGAHSGELNWNAVAQMTQDQYQKYMLTLGGIADAKGAINSGESFTAIKSRYDYLNSSKASTLTIAEQGERDQLGQYMNNLKADYIGTITQTPQGQQISQGLNQSLAAIKNSPVDDAQKSQQYHQAYNDYQSKLVNYGKAHGIPEELIKPVPPQVVAQAQSGFMLGSDPATVMEAINNQNKGNGAWLAGSMQTPAQQEIVHTANLLQNTPAKGFANDFIVANQTGRDYGALNIGSEGVSSAEINAKIASALSPTLGYISSQSNGQQRVSAMMGAVANYVKYQAIAHNDLQLSGLNDYIAKANDALGNAYQVVQGSGFKINAAELNISEGDAAALGNYLHTQAINSLSHGKSTAEQIAAMDANPLLVTYSPSGNLLVQDSTGTTVYSTPYSTTLLNAAKHDKTTNDRVNKERAFDFVTGTTPTNPLYGGSG